MELFDKDGNLVEGILTQEEFDKKLQEELEKKKLEEPKPEPEPEPEPKTKEDEAPAWAKVLLERVDRLDGNQRTQVIDRFASGMDSDTRKEFEQNYTKLSGYEETPDGMSRKAEDAYLLTTGQRFNQSQVNMQNIAAGHSGPSGQEVTKQESSESKEIRSLLGISDDDVEKYGNK